MRNQWRIREITFTIYLLRKSPLSLLGFSMVGAILFCSLFAPLLATHDPMTVSFGEQFQPPSWKHFFGTDNLGMDIYSRVLHAGLYDLLVGTIVLAVSTSIGVTVGIVAGYMGGKTDEVLMRLTDIFLAVPGLIMAMAFSVAMQSKSLYVLVLAISLVHWPSYSRLVRGQVLIAREQQFIEAARVVGANRIRIMLRHIAPNVISPVIVRMTMDAGGVILTAATLSFLGMGAAPGTPEWGRMIADGRVYMQYHPWIVLWPGLMIFITVLGFNLVGDGLRDVLDPRARR